MNQTITKELLDSVGIATTPATLQPLLDELNEMLEERVGTEIAQSLDDDQLKTLIALQQAGDEADTQRWLGNNVPELQEIVQDEIDIILDEVAQNADGLTNN